MLTLQIALLVAHVALMPWLGLLSFFGVLSFSVEKDHHLMPVFLFTGATAFAPAGALYLLPSVLQSAGVTSLPPVNLWFAAWGGCLIVGATAGAWFLRYGVAHLERWKRKHTKTSALERNKRTDVREINKFLPREIGKYDPRKYFNIKNGVFIGLDETRKPIYIDYNDFRLSHIALAGGTRIGKGVAAQMLLYQAVLVGEFVVVLDPKVDEWMPSVFKQACEEAGMPYRFLDLRQEAPKQTNLFVGCNLETLENMLVGGFSLTERGEAADFYRLADRKAARECARWLYQNPGATSIDALATFGDSWKETAPAFHAYMEEMAEIDAVNHPGGPGMLEVAEGALDGDGHGGVLYVVGDMINPRILRLQRMILLRLLFHVKTRGYGNGGRTVAVLADEFRVHISRPFMVSLGASAGWGLHTIEAFQSFKDLADCPADLDPDSVKGSVMENCQIKISYAIEDRETREDFAKNTGSILVDDESRVVEKNIALRETLTNQRRISLAERYFVDENMLKMLPKGCGVLMPPRAIARFCYTSPVPVEKDPTAIQPTATPPQAKASVVPRTSAVSMRALAPLVDPNDVEPDDF